MEKASTAKRPKIPIGRLISLYWLPVALWMGIIFFLSGRHSVMVSPEYLLNFLFFKTLHLIEYAALFVLFVRAIHNTLNEKKVVNSYAIAFLLTTMYAMTDELHQQFVPSREGTLRDVIIDAAGAALVWYYLSVQLPKAHGKLRRWVEVLDIPF